MMNWTDFIGKTAALVHRGAPDILSALILDRLLPEVQRRAINAIIRSAYWLRETNIMANLIVRNVDERIVRALKSRAGEHGRSAEAEHRELLAAVLLKSRTKSFAEVLASIPNVGEDADFARIDDDASPNVLG